jgi:ABC-type bacteriocin/lantibiotic exporter with double-glycine peptidase domain
LGWSALVGVSVMIALIPVPAWLGKFISGAQRQKMQATDHRVQYIKEVLTILRMVKQFGWERQVMEQIGAKREEELHWILRRGLLRQLNTAANYIVSAPALLDTSYTDQPCRCR